MKMDFNPDSMMNLLGITDFDDEASIFEKCGDFFTHILNTNRAFRMDDFSWKLSYLNNGDQIKFEKIGKDGVVAELILYEDTLEYTGKNTDDPDIQKLIYYLALGIFINNTVSI